MKSLLRIQAWNNSRGHARWSTAGRAGAAGAKWQHHSNLLPQLPGSVLLLGLGEACSSCLHALCSPCCHACAVCCSALQEAPVEELSCHAHCHRVLFGSCCEPIECLEFCLECCEICHRG
ncbi:hypothetical protein D4764_13G0004640 [Takifugu flavidus]|uniref:MyoD family inhibitor domain-containing protein n=1 Tax=Takifugu flavidus TaxID=433684 RepID=A0A5C6P7Z2_9TELE|nr:hypothetical protein D4764_13G0004640 [Takifugu flavidus]